MIPAGLSVADLLAMYRKMVLARTFEDQVYYLFLRGGMPGTVHQSQGQEAVAVGVSSALQPGDFLMAGHRPHGHALAKGITARAAMAELFAKEAGCSRGKGGSMHLGDPDVGMICSLAIVGAGCTIAPGMALAFKLRGTKQVAATIFGDGGSNEGAFHEGLNFAAVRQLPVIFVCENNLYGASTAYNQVSLVTNVADRACAYGITGQIADGMDVLAVYQAMTEAIARARAGGGPTLLECKTYRFGGHSRSDRTAYRPKEEAEAWKQRDPITLLGNRLLAEGLATDEQLAALRREVDEEVADAITFAQNAPSPAAEEALEDVFA
ncbi:MAG: thiamine pyrophosphate-dependent dehydrogenase E1 component subunit alpha [Gammaproteobacteria bacterium]|nr:thiamine pyrophosphate-dependent dehydrogenase E1 component subunit alpha [Gammaproteobacteria bacterium]